MDLAVEICQLEAQPDKDKNLRRVLETLERSKADLVVFPEYTMGVGEKGVTREYVESTAEALDGPFVQSVVDKTGELGLAAVVGIYLREKAIYNAVVFAANGRVRCVYRKVHLFDAYGYCESSAFAPGSSIAVTPYKGFRLGFAVCFDLRFPELFRAMAYAGVDVFIVPAAWYCGPYKLHQWYVLTLARAHENTAYLVAANQTGRLFSGHSLVASPMGYVEADLGERERSLVVVLEAGEVRRARELVPVLKLVRRDVYARYLNPSG